jgi:hypothetical protein
LADSIEERMKNQKSTIRAVKKEQRESAKALKREQEKLQKALDKAAAKLEKEAEKVRIKAAAKAERERLKAEKKAGNYPPMTEEVKAILEPAHVQRPSNAVVDVEVLVLSPQDQAVVAEAITNPPEPNEALKEAAQRYEEEATSSPYKLPME